MKPPEFLADENIAAPLVRALRNAGWDTHFLVESHPGIDDKDVLRLASQANRILLTADKDFGELIFRMRLECPGVLLLRLPPAPWNQHWRRLHLVLIQYANRLEKTFTVVEQKRVRFRPL